VNEYVQNILIEVTKETTEDRMMQEKKNVKNGY
jgi:hypothetical protein